MMPSDVEGNERRTLCCGLGPIQREPRDLAQPFDGEGGQRACVPVDPLHGIRHVGAGERRIAPEIAKLSGVLREIDEQTHKKSKPKSLRGIQDLYSELRAEFG